VEYSQGQSSFDPKAPELSSCCFWCSRRHPAPHRLSVCPACVAALRERRFPMGLLEMSGSYPLNAETIDEVVSQRSPGNYALGYLDGPAFVVFYVGRSDSDVRGRLHQWVGMPSRYECYAPSTRAAWGAHRRGPLPRAPALDRVGNAVDSTYTRFAYSYAHSADAAFEKECRNYHDFGEAGGLDNAVHPAAGTGSASECLAHRH
jgi:hypothetical protein